MECAIADIGSYILIHTLATQPQHERAKVQIAQQSFANHATQILQVVLVADFNDIRPFFPQDFALMILDRMLPGCDGIEVLATLRVTKPELRVIMLTARGGIDDRVEGLDAGAIDYMTKPFVFDELTARVRAHLRAPAQTESTRLEAVGIELDLLTRRVTRDGIPARLLQGPTIGAYRHAAEVAELSARYPDGERLDAVACQILCGCSDTSAARGARSAPEPTKRPQRARPATAHRRCCRRRGGARGR